MSEQLDKLLDKQRDSNTVSRVNISDKTEVLKVVTLKVTTQEIKNIDDDVKKWKEKYKTVDRSKLIRALMSMSESINQNHLAKALEQQILGKV